MNEIKHSQMERLWSLKEGSGQRTKRLGINKSTKTNLMDTNQYNQDLVQVRRILEVAAVKMAADRRTTEDLNAIKIAQQAFADQTLKYTSGVEENILFHLKVVSASNNNVLKSLFMKIIPDLLDMYNKSKHLDDIKYLKGIQEHTQIIDNIINQDSQAAEKTMEVHLENENS